MKKKSFIPLRDLLQKGHEDRVKDYLEKMKGLSIDEIVNSNYKSEAKDPETDDQVGGNRA